MIASTDLCSVGRFIQAFLDLLGWTREDLRGRLGLGRAPFDGIMTGKTKLSSGSAQRLANVLAGTKGFWLATQGDPEGLILQKIEWSEAHQDFSEFCWEGTQEQLVRIIGRATDDCFEVRPPDAEGPLLVLGYGPVSLVPIWRLKVHLDSDV